MAQEKPADIAEALERWETCKSGWGEIYNDARNDQLFYAGNQWEDGVVAARGERPTLVTSHLQQFVHHVANEIRESPPEIKVAPINDLSNVPTAKVIQGLIKSCEKISSADIAYETGSENAIISSFGWIRLDHDYIAPNKFEQHILIKTVVDPLSTYIDSNSILPDGSDAKYGFVLDTMSVDTFKQKWPGKDPISFGETNKSDDNVMVAEYFYLDVTTVEIGLLADGRVLELDEIEKLNSDNIQNPPLVPLKTRSMEKNIVRRQKLSGAEILEQGKFPGSYIPLVPVYGEIRWVDGERQIWSLIRNAKDSQRMINYYNSLMVESLSKAPQAPFMGMVGQFETDPESWKNPHRNMVLQYDRLEIDGGLAPAPQRLMPPPMPAGAYEAKMAAIEEMKAAMGLNDSNMGQPDNATSGLAISKRQKQGETAIAHFSDNLNRSVAHVGRIWLSMKDEIYDTPRIERVVNSEDEAMHVTIGEGSEFDINAGKYDVSITAGPSFMSRREETYQMLLNVIQTNPALMGVIGDLVFKYSDTPGSDVISERIKKTIPPQLLEGEKGGDKVPPQAQAQIQQLTQKVQQDEQLMQQAVAKVKELQQELTECQMELKNKQGELLLKGKEIEIKQQDLQIKAAQAQTQAQQSQVQEPSESEKVANIAQFAVDAQAQHFDQSAKMKELELKEDDFKLRVAQAQIQALALLQNPETGPDLKKAILGIAAGLGTLMNDDQADVQQ